MADLDLDDLLEDAKRSRNKETLELANKISALWSQGVIPSHKLIQKLHRLNRPTSPCARLMDNGQCQTWLRRYGADSGVVAAAPWICPFASDGTRPSTYQQCPGYRTQ